MNMKRLAAACLFAGALAGCMLPETIDAKIELDGYHYQANIKSRVVSTDALKVILNGQELTEHMEERLRAEEKGAAEQRGYKQFNYVRNGRYEAVVEVAGDLDKPDAAIGFPFTRSDTRNNNNFLTIERMTDGSVEVKTAKLSDKMKQDLPRLGFAPTGPIEIKVSGQVLVSNAAERSGNTHRWKFSSWNDYVYLKVAVP